MTVQLMELYTGQRGQLCSLNVPP